MTLTVHRAVRFIDPTVPVHKQPTMVARQGQAPGCRHHHSWFMRANGVECAGVAGCGRILVRLDGRRGYRGRRRMPHEPREGMVDARIVATARGQRWLWRRWTTRDLAEGGKVFGPAELVGAVRVDFPSHVG